MSSDREALRRDFLDRAGFGDAARERLPGDASTRSYERLRDAAGRSFIFMDQVAALESPVCPPEATPEERAALGWNAMARLAAGRVEAFVAVANWLRGQGLSAPEVLANDPEHGFAVLEDLGDDLFARLLEAGAADEGELYAAATDALLRLHAVAPPGSLATGAHPWPLLTFDAVAHGGYLELLPEWLPKVRNTAPPGAEAIAEWRAIWAPVLSLAESVASVFCLRDYHAENLIWLPEREGLARVGLLDFQDAVRAHPSWDLSMLLHDARRDVSPELEAAVLARYLSGRADLDRDAFLSEYRQIGALNIVRILGLFSRLVTRDGKPRYLGFMPRLWDYFDRCADAVPGLPAWFERHLPRPEAS